MPFILICATLGDRLAELKRLINSLENQDYNEWKLIIVHQGTRNRELLEQMSKSQRIEYINSSKKGLSLARNLALKLLERRHIDSDCIIGYPDDDCYFSKNTLSIVAEFLKKYNSFVFQYGEQIDSEKSIEIKPLPKILISNSPSIGIYHRYNKNLYFDELFGLGSKFPSCEDSDFVHQLSKRSTVAFTNNQLIYHEQCDGREHFKIEVGLNAVYGMGAFLAKMIIYEKQYHYLIFIITFIVKQIGGIILGTHKGRLFHLKSIQRLFKGFKEYLMEKKKNDIR
ncbi:glycosyltransferase family 2 protein [Defluviitalea saccharophila]|uniref:Glycosyltransferase family 2 protein n=1 Tax=Defluviitalea saccharophila TaxID=879970 RepID=A0ABZ2Y382_9FIRM